MAVSLDGPRTCSPAGRMLPMTGRIPLLAGGRAYAVSEDDRYGQDDAREHEPGRADDDRPLGEVGDDPDREADDRDAEREVAESLAERGDPGDARPLHQHGVVVHHAVHPWATNACSIVPGRSSSANE